MSEIALYNTLRRIPGITDAEAKEAVADVASSKDMAKKADIKDMATKADIKDVKHYIDVAIARLETRILRQQIVIAGLLLAGMALLKFI